MFALIQDLQALSILQVSRQELSISDPEARDSEASLLLVLVRAWLIFRIHLLGKKKVHKSKHMRQLT